MYVCFCRLFKFVFFNDTATTEIYTLSLHDALPIWTPAPPFDPTFVVLAMIASVEAIFLSTFVLISQNRMAAAADRSEEHTSELQSRQYLVCRLLLEKKTRRTIRKNNFSSKVNRTNR